MARPIVLYEGRKSRIRGITEIKLLLHNVNFIVFHLSVGRQTIKRFKALLSQAETSKGLTHLRGCRDSKTKHFDAVTDYEIIQYLLFHIVP